MLSDRFSRQRISDPMTAEQPGTSHAFGSPHLITASAAGAGVSMQGKNPTSGTKVIERKRPTVSTIRNKSSFPAEPGRKTGDSPRGAFISLRGSLC